MTDDLFYVSASQLQTYVDCPRKWAFGKLPVSPAVRKLLMEIVLPDRYISDKITFNKRGSAVVPSNKGAAKGTKIHAIAEAWFEKREVPPDTPEGRIFLSGLEHWDDVPVPCPDGVETAFKFKVDEGLGFRGFMDLCLPELSLVGDHKTTKAKRYIKSEDELRNNIQSICYLYAMVKLFGVKEPKGRWVYYLTQGKAESHRRDFSLPVEELDARWAEYVKDMKDMLDLRNKKVNPIEVKPNYGACNDFGGCPFRSVCSIFREKNMTTPDQLLAKLRAKKPPAETPTCDDTLEAKLEESVRKAPAPTLNPPEAKQSLEELDNPPPVEEKPAKPTKKKTKKAKAKKVPSELGAGHLTVLIDVLPTKGCEQFTHLSDLAHAAGLQVAEGAKVPHWQMVEYGKGGAALAVALEKHLDEIGFTGTILVDTNTAEAKAVLSMLIHKATAVYRGIK